MSIAAIVSIITGLSTIVGAFVYFFKQAKPSAEQKKENADANIGDAQKKAEETGKPQ